MPFHLLNAFVLTEDEWEGAGYPTSPIIFYVFGLLIMGVFTLYYSLRRSSTMASLGSTIRCNPRVSVNIESHGLTSGNVNTALADLFSDRRWYAVIEVAGAEPVENVVEPTLCTSLCKSKRRNIIPTSLKGAKRKTTF